MPVDTWCVCVGVQGSGVYFGDERSNGAAGFGLGLVCMTRQLRQEQGTKLIHTGMYPFNKHQLQIKDCPCLTPTRDP
jgi:hypothetical protein